MKMWKSLLWSAIVAAIWCLSMQHAEHNGYKRGYEDGHAVGVDARLSTRH